MKNFILGAAFGAAAMGLFTGSLRIDVLNLRDKEEDKSDSQKDEDSTVDTTAESI